MATVSTQKRTRAPYDANENYYYNEAIGRIRIDILRSREHAWSAAAIHSLAAQATNAIALPFIDTRELARSNATNAKPSWCHAKKSTRSRADARPYGGPG